MSSLSAKEKIKMWVDANIRSPFSKLSPQQRLVALSVGACGGLFPIPFATTAVTMLFVLLVGLNAPQTTLAIALNLLVAPIEVAAIPSLARCAGMGTGADTTAFTAAALLGSMSDGVFALLSASFSMLLHAVATWAVVTMCAAAVAHRFGVLTRGSKRDADSPSWKKHTESA